MPLVDRAGELRHAPFRVSRRSHGLVSSFWAGIGATVQGRHLFDLTHGWEADPPAGEHLVVVSHRPRPEGWHPETDVPFVEDVAAAVEEAKRRAGDQVVAVCAGNVGGQALALGLVDEVAMDVVPVVFGKGKRYFGPVDSQPLLCDPSVVIQGDRSSTCGTRSAAEKARRRRGPAPAKSSCSRARPPPRSPRATLVMGVAVARQLIAYAQSLRVRILHGADVHPSRHLTTARLQPLQVRTRQYPRRHGRRERRLGCACPTRRAAEMKTVDLARLATGTLAVLGPDPMIKLTGSRPDTGLRTTARILGARYLVQSAVTVAAPSHKVRTAGAVVDVLHASSMIAVSAVDRSHRRAALASAAVAAAFAVADLAAR